MVWLRLSALMLWLLAGGAVAALFYYLRLRRVRDAFIAWGYRIFLKIARVRVEVRGTLSEQRPLLLVTNHSSYMDIPVLASVTAVSFTPKLEIAGWPVIGFFCRISDCVFIDRRASRTGHNKAALEEALRKGRVISLFPEGTTGDGKRVLPFRSSYFSLAEEAKVAVQPASICYGRINNLPVDSAQMPRVAWYGDMWLLPHVLDFLRLGRVTAYVHFHPPVKPEDFASRKEMAAHCRKLIENDLVKNRR